MPNSFHRRMIAPSMAAIRYPRVAILLFVLAAPISAVAQQPGPPIREREEPCLVAFPPTTLFLTHGFKAEYYHGWAARRHYPDNLGAVRVDPNIAFSDDSTSGTQPWNLPFRKDSNGISIRWTATFTAPATGTYHFWLDSGDQDGGLILLDGIDVLDIEDLQNFQTTSRPIDLTQGTHFLEVYYRHIDGKFLARLIFQPPGAAALAPIPDNLLSPSVPFGPNTHSINIGRLTQGTLVVDQFAASDGVNFVPSPAQPSGSYSSHPTLTGPCPKLVYNDSFDAGSGQHDAPGRQPLAVTFTQPQLRVKVFVGTQQDYSGTSIRGGSRPPATLRAYNSAGDLLGADHLDSVGPAVTALLEVGRWQADISAITVSFDRSDIGERISGLSVESTGPWQGGPPDTAPPVVSILSPTEGVSLPDPQVTLHAAVTDNSGLIDSVMVGGTSLTPDPSVTSGCNLPTCHGYSGAISVSPGPNTILVVARDHAGNVGQALVHVGVGSTHIHVVDDNGQDAAGTDIFLDQHFVGTTDSVGRLDVTPAVTSGALVARRLVRSVPVDHPHSPREARDGWMLHVYFTSQPVNDSGSVTAFTITDPSVIQELRVSSANTLIGLHLLGTLEWDATLSRFDDFALRMQQTSQFLYNATDGQMYVEQYDLEDDSGGWDDADFQIHADQSLRPNVPWHPGGLWGTFWGGRGRAQLGPNLGSCDGCWNKSGDPPTFAHEFGHYGFDLFDEYSDDNAAIKCTANLSGSGPFSARGSNAACMMNNQWDAQKLCSDRSENPHVHDTSQGDESCWHHFVGKFNDSQGQWSLRTPDSRGAIPGTLPNLLTGWQTRVWKTDNTRSNLCSNAPVYQFTTSAGTPVAGISVVLHTTYSAEITEGKTDSNGMISILGGHVGDEVTASNASTRISTSDCPMVITFGSLSLPARRVIVGTPPFELQAAIEPTALAGRALLRVRSSARLNAAPSATFVAVGGQKPQAVPLKFDSRTNSYVGGLSGLQPLAQINARIATSPVRDQMVVYRSISAVLSPPLPAADFDLTSADGHFELHLSAGALPKGANLTISPTAKLLPKWDPSLRLIDGPYSILASSGGELRKSGVVRFFLPTDRDSFKALGVDPSTLSVWRFDSNTGKWTAIENRFNSNLNIITARIERLGDYTLAARPSR